MNTPNEHQLSLLGEAIKHLSERDYSPYLKLKRMLAEKPSGWQTDFRQTFENYYGLNAGGVTEAFKARYFALLFSLVPQNDGDPYTPILKELYEIPRRKADKALQCSFVSKLVAIHEEACPIFDRHVSHFFGLSVPSIGSVDFRIAGFVANLKWLSETYRCWSLDSQFQKILLKVEQEHPSLKGCSSPRVADFLVWTVGNKKLGSSSATGPKA